MAAARGLARSAPGPFLVVLFHGRYGSRRCVSPASDDPNRLLDVYVFPLHVSWPSDWATCGLQSLPRAHRRDLTRPCSQPPVAPMPTSFYENTSIADHARSRQRWLILFSLGLNPPRNENHYPNLAPGRPMHNRTRTRPGENIAPILQSAAGKRSGARPRIPPESGRKRANAFASGGRRIRFS